jgi:hypothetical protein
MNRDWKEDVLAEIREDLAAMEAAGKGAKDIAELEALTIEMSQKTGKRVFESWMKARAQRAIFPLECPRCGKAMVKAGLSYKQMRSIWGKVEMPKQGYHCRDGFYDERQFVEGGLDASGVLPEALHRAIKLVSKVDFAEACELLNDWGLPVSKSSLERLSQTDGEEAWEQAQTACQKQAERSLPKRIAKQARSLCD